MRGQAVMLDLLKDIADRSGGLTREDARRLCAAIPADWYTSPCGYSETSNSQFAKAIREVFPAFNWRIIIDRSGERSRWALTIDDDDPREHYFDRLGGQCIHCGKSAREVSRIDEVNGDDEFLSELEKARQDVAHVIEAERAGEHISADTLGMRLR